MKITIPEQLKADVPQTPWGKLLTATPIIMTVLATMLAGLASSEMTRAQYDRAFGAQLQSKAGDQWSFFQAKRLRSAVQRNSVDLLQSTIALRPLESSSLKRTVDDLAQKGPEAAKVGADIAAVLDSTEGQKTLPFLLRGGLPPVELGFTPNPSLKSAMDAVEASSPDAEMAVLLAKVTDRDLEQALGQARDRVRAFDDATRPVNQTIDRLEGLISSLVESAQPKGEPGPTGDAALMAGLAMVRNFTASRLRYNALRYEMEARLNQSIANLYELQVRKSNTSAERHHARSQRFFYGMLAAQMAVIIATFAIAARQRNLLWSIAAVAGLAAIALGIYVYLYV